MDRDYPKRTKVEGETKTEGTLCRIGLLVGKRIVLI